MSSDAPAENPNVAAARVVEKEMDILDPEFIKNRNLTEEQQARISELQQEIDDIWSKPGNYKVDEDGWKTMPIFMDREITDEDIANNHDLATLQNIKFEDADPVERAQNLKEQGNKMLIMSMNPEQTNFKNFARSALRFYAEALQVQCGDKKLTAVIYSNRSMANFILGNFGHGIEDAQKCVVLDRNFTKGYYRGAKCAEKIRKFELARQLIAYGMKTDPAPSDVAVNEFNALLALVKQNEEQSAKKEKKAKVAVRADAADTSHIRRKLQNEGITCGLRPEVASDQWAQLRVHKPYFDGTGLLHVPILIMWDEYNQTDFAQDVASDAALGDLIEEMMPCPWDDKGRYQVVDGMCVYFKIDDGVAMPKYYRVDPDWQILEIMRTKTYVLPALVGCFHVVPEGSELLKEITFEKNQ